MSAPDDSLKALELRMKELMAEAARLTAQLEQLEKDIELAPDRPQPADGVPPSDGDGSRARAEAGAPSDGAPRSAPADGAPPGDGRAMGETADSPSRDGA